MGDDTLVRVRGTSGSVANDRMSDDEWMVYEHHVREYEVASGVDPTSIGDATTPG